MKNIKDKENIKNKKKGLESMREAIKFLMQKKRSWYKNRFINRKRG